MHQASVMKNKKLLGMLYKSNQYVNKNKDKSIELIDQDKTIAKEN